MNRILANAGRVSRGTRVLDSGCGIGGSAIWLARNIGAEVTGINLHRQQLAQAEELVRRGQVDSLVSFQREDFSNTRLPAESFDVVWALESMCYAEDKRSFLAESWRVLRPGGRLVVADGFLIKPQLTGAEQAVVDRWCRRVGHSQCGWGVPIRRLAG